MPSDPQDERPTRDQLLYLRWVEYVRDEVADLTFKMRRLHVMLDRRVRHLRDRWGLPGRAEASADDEVVV